jgi:hypothetical protein
MLRQRIKRLEMHRRRCGLGKAENGVLWCQGQPSSGLGTNEPLANSGSVTGPKLRRLKDRIHRATRQQQQPHDPTHEDWLDFFESWGREGRFDCEPDFSAALAFYRDALLRAKEQTDPPFDPPRDFAPRMASSLRLLNWRNKASFPKVHEGWGWLIGMLLRLHRGTPAVTEADFANLASWFHANFDRLLELSRPRYLLVLQQGRKESVSNLRDQVDKGARAVHAGEVAEDLRWLQACYGREIAAAAAHGTDL